MVETVSNASLRCEMHDNIRQEVVKHLLHGIVVLDTDRMHFERVERCQARNAVVFQLHVIIRRETVNAADFMAFREQAVSQFASNKSGSTGQQDFHA